MLLRKSLGNPSICLRCRIRQSYRTNGVPPRSLLAAPHSRFSTFANLRSQTSFDDTSFSQPDLRKSDVFPDNEREAPKFQVRRVSNPDGPRTRMKTIRKTRRTRNKHVLLEDYTPLDRMTLGQKAEVLVLRDVDIDFGHKGEMSYDEAGAADAKEREQAREEIEASIASETSVAGQEEVNVAINQLKPKSGKVRRIFSAEHLEKLRKSLHGFLLPQLRRFVKIAEDERKLEALKRIDDRINAKENNDEASSRELPKSIWQEGITDIETRLPRGALYLEPERLKKAELIDYIIKRIWHVTTVEEMDAVGEIEVGVKLWHLELVTRGFGIPVRESALDRIGIQRNVKIEVYKPENIIRFTANRTDATKAINDLQIELGNVGSSKFSLDPFKPMLERQGHQSILNIMNQRDIETIGTLSNANIEVLDDSLIIRATKEKNVATARRFLINMLFLRTRTETKTFTAATDKGFLYKNLSETALPYRIRQTNLGRWGYPVKRLAVPKDDEKNTAPAKHDARFSAAGEGASSSVASQVASFLQSPSVENETDVANTNAEELQDEASVWNPKITTQISAAYGNVLHSFDSEPGVSSMSAETAVESKSPVFLSSIPGANPFIGGIASLGAQLTPGSYGRTPDVLMFRFVPFPWHFKDAAAASEDIPKFSLRLAIDENGAVRYSGSGLTLADRNAYVLMPDKVTDVAFNRREMLWSMAGMKSRQIRAFVKRTQESIEMKGNIRVPPTITLSIPAWSIHNIERYPDLPTVYTNLGEERLITFSHVGTEHRQSLRLDFDKGRFRGSMSSVEAGRLGGRRNEVRLRVRKSPDTPEQLESVLGTFVENGMRVAEWLDNAINLRLDTPPAHMSRKTAHKKYPDLSEGKGPYAYLSIWKGSGEEQNKESTVQNASPESTKGEHEPENSTFEADAAHWEATPWQDGESSRVQAQESENSSSDPQSTDGAKTEGEDASQSALSDSASTSKEDGDQKGP
ncbi:mitochondrial inner-membrane-bound regulator-domain-containing protein [Phyllosticta capitalensis]|uniref:mitochondrial inner-membrane-bound regulator-domain-containing protein n=1 Tax=Phyllosticta capitalensis TaxID=121624 RepID=UPI00312F3ADA